MTLTSVAAMDAPSIADDPMMSLVIELQRQQPVAGPYGTRHEVPFHGTATSPHWDGEWLVSGVDHITRGTQGTALIDVHVTVTDGTTTILYRGHGRGSADGIREGVTFETDAAAFAWLNDTLAVGVGAVDGATLTVDLYAVT